MNARCTLGYDADDILTRLDGEHGPAEEAHARLHAEDCAACRAIARTRTLARRAWVAETVRDEVLERERSERRLVMARPRASRSPVAGFALGIALASAGAALLPFFRGSAPWLEKPASRASAFHVAGGLPGSAATSARAETDGDDRPRSAPRRAVLTTGCATCRVAGGTVRAGMDLPEGERITVPVGARLAVGFAIGAGLVDPRSGAELEGPAVARAAADGALAVEQGRAVVRATHEVVVYVPGGRLVANDAAYSLRVGAGGVRVTVTSGSVRVLQGTPTTERSIAAGESVLLRESEPAAPAAPVVAAPHARDAQTAPAVAVAVATPLPVDLDEAVARARAGDRSELSRLARGADDHEARRASFKLAELELASGDKNAGETRLAQLFDAPEASLAFDAATLYALAQGTSTARAYGWQRYLRAAPPSPYRLRARLERAEALLDAGTGHSEVTGILHEAAATAPESLSDRDRRRIAHLRLRVADAP